MSGGEGGGGEGGLDCRPRATRYCGSVLMPRAALAMCAGECVVCREVYGV